MDRNAIADRIKEKMGELENQMKQLQTKADQASEDVRHQWEKRRLEVKEKQQELGSKLDELKNTADSRLDDVRSSLESTLESATKNLKNIKDNLFGK